MSMVNGADQGWALLADIEEDQRREQMQARYTELAALSEEERRGRLAGMAKVEYVLPDDKIRAFHLTRLRVWLSMDPTMIQSVAASYDAIMDQLGGDVAMRRIGIVQTLAKSFSATEQEQLRVLLPRIFGDRGTATSSWGANTSPGLVTRRPVNKPWWAFWRQA